MGNIWAISEKILWPISGLRRYARRMADHTRELKSIAEQIQSYARKIRRAPKGEDVEKWARRIVSLTNDLETLARKIERG